MVDEVWKEVKGYEGLYEVSNMGRVRSLDITLPYGELFSRFRKGRILKPRLTQDGYGKVALMKDKKAINFFVHRLVALAFVENLNDKPQVNHIDEVKSNNCASNLEWVTNQENAVHGNRVKRISNSRKKPVQAFSTDGKLVHTFKSSQDAGFFGFNSGCVTQCCKGNQKTHKGYIWKYLL